MSQKYPQTKYILHWCIVRVILVGPLAIMRAIAEKIYNLLDKLAEDVSTTLPECYTRKWVEWEKLTPNEQKAIEKVARARDVTRDRVMFQTYKT